MNFPIKFIPYALTLLRMLKMPFSESSLPARAIAKLERRVDFARFKGPRIIPEFARLYPTAFFVQIGSNDGDQLDPLKIAINTYPWRGIMIEPVPYVFEGLKRNYGDNSRVRLENVAISARSGMLPFYHLAKASAEELKTLPRWYDALGSFSRDVVLKHRNFIPDIAERITERQIPTITFDELCRRNGVQHVDLLHTDTEGHDYEILKTIDFQRYRPKLVIYEHHHFSPEDRRACQQLMRDNGYAVFEEILDTWCLDLHSDPAAARRLRRYWLDDKTTL